MKKILLLLLVLGAGVTGCKKANDSCETVMLTAPSEEVTKLQQYISDNNITAEKDNRGFFYKINAAGTGSRPTVCSTVTVNYAVRLTTNYQVESASNVSFSLAQLIIGWQEGIPLIAKGGSIVLYLPPSLAYGTQANGQIPANSILIFSIDLVDVQ